MNEHKNIITIEDEIKEFSDKPVKSSALFKALEEKGVPDSSEASAGDVLSLDENKKPTWAAPSGGGGGGTSAFVVHVVLNWDESDNGWVPTVDEPITDIIEALDADIPVVAHCGKSEDGETPSGYFVLSLANYYPAETVADVSIVFDFFTPVFDDSSTTLFRYSLEWYRNSWLYEENKATVVSHR